jgi:hypothetical protein
MVRRLIFGTAIGLLMMVGTAAAQDSPSPTTTQPTTTTTEESTTTSVLGTVITNPPEAPTTAPTVGGVVVPRPLPRTGSDVGLQVVVGAGLTAAGLAFAATARLRRHRATNPAQT